jgi:Uma2 family endonuclease
MADGVTAPAALPNHLHLPFRDGVPVRDAIEGPQSALLTESLSPLLSQLFPEDRYFIGADVGIYWRLVEERLRGAKSPDWYLVTDVPHLLDGEFRHSYVMWHEQRLPLIVLEFAPSDSTEEHDRMPEEGEFWVYENRIRPSYYGIFWTDLRELEMYHHTGKKFKRLKPNKRNHYPIAPLSVELGLWQGRYENYDATWLRWWDLQGNLQLTGAERAENMAERAKRLAAKLRELGVDPDAV